MSQEHVDKFRASLDARRIKRCYVAGAFTADTRWQEEQNVRNAEAVGYRVALAGCYPVIPHANTRHYFLGIQTPQFWYEATMAEMMTCDAVVMVPGWAQSVGAVAEKAEAERLDIPVFLHVRDLVTWLESA
ncbi:MAG: DUF1937 family protein [Acidobacteriia bacterium]|nr:DUF1937 family protein [Terriglobia bacterium]